VWHRIVGVLKNLAGLARERVLEPSLVATVEVT